MEHTVEKLSGNKVKISFKAPAADFEEAVEKAYLKMRGQISVPGFRKGKAPRKLIERMYGAGVFYEDALEILFPEAYMSRREGKRPQARGPSRAGRAGDGGRQGPCLLLRGVCVPRRQAGPVQGRGSGPPRAQGDRRRGGRPHRAGAQARGPQRGRDRPSSGKRRQGRAGLCWHGGWRGVCRRHRQASDAGHWLWQLHPRLRGADGGHDHRRGARPARHLPRAVSRRGSQGQGRGVPCEAARHHPRGAARCG